MSTMVEKLQLVVDATTGSSETRFQRLTERARETGDASVRAASDVATAADRVATAQLRQADEAGKLRVAQLRLQELQEKGNASATQLAGAEEKVSTAQRRLHQATREVVAATDAQSAVQREAADEAERTGRAQQELGNRTDELKSRIRGLIAGAAIGTWLRGVTDDFLTGARAASSLGISMNATTAQAGRLSQLLASVGLESGDILEIQAEFAQKVAANADALSEFGAEVQKNEDGTTNWALTLEDALINLQKIPDATKRNATGFRLFGEEGYKQLSRILSTGASVEEALEAIGTPFSDEDVAATREYDAAMMRLRLTSGTLGRSIGREVVPVLTALVDGFGDVAAVVTAIPLPIAVATAAAIALGVTGFSPTAAAGARLSIAMATVRAEVALASAPLSEGGAAAGVLGAGMAGAGALGGGLLQLVGGPLGAGLILAGTAFYFARDGAEDFAAAVERGLPRVDELKRQGAPVAQSIRQVAQELEREAGWWEARTAAIRGASEMAGAAEGSGGLAGFLADLGFLETQFQTTAALTGDTTAATAGYEAALREAAEASGAFARQQADSQLAAKSLADMIAEGTTTGDEYAAAVVTAADAEARHAQTAGLADAAVAALRATTDQAYLSQLNLINAELSRNDATYAFLDAMDQANAATDDQTTSVDEVAQAHDRLKAAALGGAEAAADAAVAAATANGAVLTELAEAQIRADAVIADLQGRLNTPGLGAKAREEIQGIIDRLTTAKDNGTIEATLQTLGVDKATGELDAATEDREAIVRVESRNGPAVEEYLTRLTTRERLAIVRVESRNGPAVDTYLDGLAHERLAIIRVETRGGPDVDRYLDSLASQDRTAVINVRRPAAGAPGAPAGVPQIYGAPAIGAGGGRVMLGSVTLDLELTGQVDRQQLATGAQRGRATIADIRAYERENGTGWRARP